MKELYVSGYSKQEVSLIGLSLADFTPRWTERAAAPSYFVFGDGLLFTVEEREQGGAVCLYSRDGEGWRLADRRVITGSQLCHIAYSDRCKCLLGACYGTGEVFSLSVNVSEKRFGSMNSYLRQGRGELAAPGASRTHCVVLTTAQNIVCTANIAQDKLYLYNLVDGRLEDRREFQLPKRCGPRHIALQEGTARVYVLTEYSSEVIVISYSGERPAILQRISTLREDFQGESFGSTLAFSPDGKFLYTANRGENTVAVFSVSRTGRLVPSSRQSCFGDWPRDLALVDDGRYVAIANQRSGNVVLCPRNAKTGEIGEPVRNLPLDQAACVKEYQGV